MTSKYDGDVPLKQARWWSGPPQPSVMKKVFMNMLLVALSMIIIMAIVGLKFKQSENVMPEINLIACAILGFAWFITARSTHARKRTNCVVSILSLAGIITLVVGLTHPAALIAGGVWCIINFVVAVSSMPLVLVAIIRYCYRSHNKIGGRRAGINHFVLAWIVTMYMSMHFAVASQSQIAGLAGNQSATQLVATDSPTMSGDKAHPNFWWCLGILVVVAVVVGAVYVVCRAAHLCGSTAVPAPTSSSSAMAAAKLHSKQALYDDEGSQQLEQLLGQLITPDNVGIWQNTAKQYDPVDPQYPFTVTINYSVLGSTDTNCMSNWHTLYTVVQWQTANPVNPFICQVIYTNQVTVTSTGNLVTNGVATGTNRWLYVTDGSAHITGVITYGDVHRPPLDASMSAPHMFFRTCVNTNEVSMTGP